MSARILVIDQSRIVHQTVRLSLSDLAEITAVTDATAVSGTEGPWDLVISVDNLLDEDYYTDLENFPNFGLDSPDFGGTGPATIVIGTFGQPKIAQASLTYNF